MSTTETTPTPVAAEISVSDLGRLLGGEAIEAAPVAAPVVKAPEAAPAAPAQTEAETVKTPVTEPDAKTEVEETTTDEKQEPQKKSKSWVDKRLSSLAQARNEAEALAVTERKRAEDLQRELETLKANPGPKTPAESKDAPPAQSGKPKLETFVEQLQDGEAYELAVERYQDARDAYRDQQLESQITVKAEKARFAQDWEAAVKTHPDFGDIVNRVRAVAPDGLQVAISQVQSDEGKSQWTDVTMYLDEHPEQLAALSKQYKANPIAATVALGKIAVALSAKASIQAAERPAPKALPKPPVAVDGPAAGPIDLEKADMETFAREVTKYL